jgi:arginine exporter protein ArgO
MSADVDEAMTVSDERLLRSHYERHAMGALTVTALSMSIICGAVIVSGWFAGAMTDRYERFFWLGAITAAVAVFVLAAASMPFGARDGRATLRIRVLITLGLGLFLIAVVLCVGAIIADFYG